ncbi:SGNH/GDSL hydrolase family protein [Aureimonas sp. ME7]|uniref:SGNH/GDSL hydrolase family protein n=1 Tax=Aureimonas sp. ME7 TaxID=2744252 RepID=UPI0015F3FDE0|nr:SGNH/GDSL hydrolase family protein [Aureimonas sp. ME7]
MNTALASWLLLPVYIWQGIGIRRRIERMLPPTGPSHGVSGSEAAPAANAIRLLVLGDSSAAGVGVDRIEEGLAARLAERMHALTGRTVVWRAVGSNSAVSADVRDLIVPNIARDAFTHILLSVGTNDVKNFHSTRRFKRGFGGLLYALRARWPDARIVWSPPVDMLRVPALPRGLAHVLSLRERMLARLGKRLCLERGVVPATTLPRVEPAGFSRDGFHASAAGAAYAAGHLAPYVLGNNPAPS